MSNKVNTNEASRQFNELAQGTQAAALRDAIERLIKSGFNPESEVIRVLENALNRNQPHQTTTEEPA